MKIALYVFAALWFLSFGIGLSPLGRYRLVGEITLYTIIISTLGVLALGMALR